MNVVCYECNGSGYIRNTTGHLDICDNCYALGYVDSKSGDFNGEYADLRRRIHKQMVQAIVILIGATLSVIGMILLTLFLIEMVPGL